MKLAKAGKTHLIVGIILVFISLASAISLIFIDFKYLGIAAYFFGTWGGVEIGRYVEARLRDG